MKKFIGIGIIALGLVGSSAQAASKTDVAKVIVLIKGKHTPKGVKRDRYKNGTLRIEFQDRGSTYKIEVDDKDRLMIKRFPPHWNKMESSERCGIPSIRESFPEDPKVCDDAIAAVIRLFRQKFIH